MTAILAHAWSRGSTRAKTSNQKIQGMQKKTKNSAFPLENTLKSDLLKWLLRLLLGFLASETLFLIRGTLIGLICV